MCDQSVEKNIAPRLLISACLLGVPCRYDGNTSTVPGLQYLAARHGAAIICPESAGGLPTPRPPAEIIGGDGSDVLAGSARVVSIEGEDVTAQFVAGAEAALQLAQQAGATIAILTERSPSCGVERIHDGQFGEGLVAGCGVTTATLRRHDIIVLNEYQWRESNLLETE